MIDNVLICDDKTDRAERWKETVETYLPGAKVDTMTGSQLADLLTELSEAEDETRRGNSLNHETHPCIQRAEQADLLILDSDLSPAPGDLDLLQPQERGAVASTLRNGYGDDVARQLRSYTAAPAIVVVNMFWARHARPRVFDLTLNQNATAVADLNITAAELTDDVLWGKVSREDGSLYRPWQRPTILEVVNTFRRSTVNGSNVDLDAEVLTELDIDASRLTPSQLDPFSKSPELLTFRDFAESALGFKYSGDGEGGAAHDDSCVTAMGLSAIRRWLERFVVPSQNVLLDAPHLAERYWRVISPMSSDLSALDKFAGLAWDDDFGAMQPALKRDLEPYAVRPIFDDIAARTLAAAQSRLGVETNGPLDAAFAEDTSRFRPLDELVQFPTDVSGEFKYRWLEEIDGVGYEPSNRLLL